MVSTILTTTVHKISSYHQMSCRSMHTSATVNAQPTRFNDLEFWFWVDAPKLSLLTVFSKREMLIDIVSQAAYRQETCPLFAEYVPGVVWDRRAKCLTAVLQYSPAVFPSLRSVTPHLTSRWDGLFLIWHPERKHYTSAGADTRSAEKRRADNQIVRFGDTPCDLFGPSQTKDDHDQKWWSCTGTTGSMTAVVTVVPPKTDYAEIVTLGQDLVQPSLNVTTLRATTSHQPIEMQEEMTQWSKW